MKKLYFIAVVAVLAMMVSCNKETEQQVAQNPEEKEALEGAQPSGIQAMRLGHQLALYGYKNESATALIEAANILADVKMAALEVAVTRGKTTVEEPEVEEDVKSFEPEELLAAAKELAGEDAELLAMIKKVEDKLAASASAERGATVCSGRSHEDCIHADDFDDYKIEFAGGELAVCTVVGDGGTDLDLYITDEDYNLVTEDVDYTDNCYCAWRPKETATYVIRIVNRGTVKNHYTIAVN